MQTFSIARFDASTNPWLRPLSALDIDKEGVGLSLGAVGPARVFRALQVELKHFLVLDAVVAPKVSGQVINRDGLAAGEEPLADSIPLEQHWAFECLEHTYRLADQILAVSPASE